MPDRQLDSWMTSAPGPFLTIKAGGSLNGVVTIMVATDGPDSVAVEATWKRDGDPQSVSGTVTGYDLARTLAHKWADQLAAGREPEPVTDAA